MRSTLFKSQLPIHCGLVTTRIGLSPPVPGSLSTVLLLGGLGDQGHGRAGEIEALFPQLAKLQEADPLQIPPELRPACEAMHDS